MTPYEFLTGVMIYCTRAGGSVTSWGRTKAHNQKVGGVQNSPHLYWLGADVVLDAPAPEGERVELARRLGLKLIVEADHDHLQPLGWIPG